MITTGDELTELKAKLAGAEQMAAAARRERDNWRAHADELGWALTESECFGSVLCGFAWDYALFREGGSSEMAAAHRALLRLFDAAGVLP